MAITIVGLGPGNPAHLTRESWDLMAHSGEIYLRTERHPTVPALPSDLTLHSFDVLYETTDDLPTVYAQIAEQIVELGRRPQGVVYAVPGHPLIGETSVLHILDHAQRAGLPVRVIAGMSFIEPVLSLLGIDGLADLQLADATEMAAAHHPRLDPDRPALVGQLYGQRMASDVKLTLMNAYPDDHPVTLVQAAGCEQATVTTIPLFELDRDRGVDHLTTLYLPPLSQVSGLAGFQQTVARLRAPGGCPWDRQQTHQSLRPHLLEEAYEVLAALDAGDSDELCEEMGDLLMQIAMHVQIAAEEGAFRFADVISGIDRKLKRRHPHVFGNAKVRDAAEVLRNWEAIKRQEARDKATEATPPQSTDRKPRGQAPASSLDGVPAILPALARAQSLGERSARVGFDWPNVEGVLDKLSEEVAELRATEDLVTRASELGDLLFTLVNVARWLAVDAEDALRGACNRFVRRYAEMEQMAQARGLDLADLTLADKDLLWRSAKAAIE
jgi:tetrapyrrole methylase family protein / MazG family protein